MEFDGSTAAEDGVCEQRLTQESGAEQIEYLVQRATRRLAGFIDEVFGEDRVGLHEALRVGRRVVELDRDKRRAELLV